MQAPLIDQNLQARDREGWTCLHLALSLSNQSPSASTWIATALDLPGIAELRETALRDLASHAAEALPLELFRGVEGSAQVMLMWLLQKLLCVHRHCLFIIAVCTLAVPRPVCPIPYHVSLQVVTQLCHLLHFSLSGSSLSLPLCRFWPADWSTSRHFPP